jgi:hypothetical protein
MKDNATLEDILSALRDKQYYTSMHFIFEKQLCIDIMGGVRFNLDLIATDPKKHTVFWQLNKPFCEQDGNTKLTLGKIL